MNKVILYSHGGSENHGCEALVRSTIKILGNKNSYILLSNDPQQDYKYGLNSIANIKNVYNDIKNSGIQYFYYLLKMKVFKSDYYYFKEKFRNMASQLENVDVALSVGGDNYCYSGYEEELRAINENFKKKSVKTILWGCSIEPEVLNTKLVNHLKSYNLIVARESITYNALQKSGFKNLRLFPDSAFQLDRIDLPLPEGFIEKNTVGINISPLILKHETNKGIVLQNIRKLINYILEETDMSIALIPHVVWESNDDREALKSVFQHFHSNKRIIFIDDHNAMELKGFIARCRFLIAARTHASIAAYSQQVPTLVLGYSVKAKGIAKDIFGTYDNFVFPVQKLASEDEVLNGFKFLQDNENSILETYNQVMPHYQNKAKESMKCLAQL